MFSIFYFLDEGPTTISPSTDPNTAVIVSTSVVAAIVVVISLIAGTITAVAIIKYKVIIIVMSSSSLHDYSYREKSLRLKSL